MMNIVIPIAGKSSSFSHNGVNTPKPYLMIKGKSMVQRAYESLNLDKYADTVIFIALEEHREKYDVDNLISSFCSKAKVKYLHKVTEGPAETLYKAKGLVNDGAPLLQTNVDQVLEWDSERFINFIKEEDPDAALVSINVVDPNYSFAKYDHNRVAVEVREKEIISNDGLIGTHYWKHAGDYFASFQKTREKDIRYNNEYHISLTFNQLIEAGKIVKDYKLKQSEKQNVLSDIPSLKEYEDKL